ncbi:polynucleotide kinase [Vibrio phage D81]
MKPILLIDIDKTIFNNHQRDHLVPDDVTRCENWIIWGDACDTDTPIEKWIAMIETLTATRMYTPVFLTSRPETSHNKTVSMIEQYLPVTHSQLEQKNMIMRPMDEHLPPAEFKRLKVNELGPDNIALAIDDDPKVCAMMLEMGIAVLNVNPKPHKPTKEAIHALATRLVREALGEEILRHVDVKPGEVMVDDYDEDEPYMSYNLLIEAKEESFFKSLRSFIQIDYRYEDDSNNFFMIFGEDIEADITRGNVFEYLFYCSAEIESL